MFGTLREGDRVGFEFVSETSRRVPDLTVWQLLPPYLYSRWYTVDDLDGAAVRVSWQRLANAVDFHLAFGLCASFLSVDGFTGGTLQAAVLQRETPDSRTIDPLNSFSHQCFSLTVNTKQQLTDSDQLL